MRDQAYPKHLPVGKHLSQEGPWDPGNKKVTTRQQFTLVGKKATGRKTAASRPREVILHLCSVLVRLLLECCIPFWASWHKEDLDLLERVQYKATKMIKRLEHLLYEERLKNWDCLAWRREGSEGSHPVAQMPDGWEGGWRNQTFLSSVHCQDKRQGAQNAKKTKTKAKPKKQQKTLKPEEHPKTKPNNTTPMFHLNKRTLLFLYFLPLEESNTGTGRPERLPEQFSLPIWALRLG